MPNSQINMSGNWGPRPQMGGTHGSPIQYLLYDAFNDTVASGSVNSTLSTPPANVQIVGAVPTRTVTDTNSKLSIGSGVASFATGGVGQSNPGLWYGVVSRGLGRVYLSKITPADTTLQAYAGWNAIVGDTLLDTFQFVTGGNFAVQDNATQRVFGTYTATAYSLAIALRSVGSYWFVKGGVYTNWTLVWGSALSSGNPFPTVRASAGGANVLTADNIRVPVALFIPTPLAYDTFSRANGALGSTETSGPDAQAVISASWTNLLGTWQVSASQAACTAVSAGSAIATYDTLTADVVHDVTCRSASNVGGVVRATSASNMVSFWYDGTNIKLDKYVLGASTNVQNTATASVANSVLRCIASGSTFTVFYNGALVGAAQGISDAGLQTGTKQGIYTNTTSGSVVNVQTFPVGTGGEYAGLNNL